jgi:hypothetical protein
MILEVAILNIRPGESADVASDKRLWVGMNGQR